MGAVQLTLQINRFRFKPKAKTKAHRCDLLRQAFDATGEFFAVDGVIAKPRCITVSRPEPAIIQNKQLDADRFGLFGEGKQFRFGKIKEVRLPVIEEDGAGLFFPLSAQNVLPHKAVEIAAKAIQALIGKSHHCFRCTENFPCGKPPAEALRLDTGDNPDKVTRRALHSSVMAAAVQQIKAIGKTGILSCSLFQ